MGGCTGRCTSIPEDAGAASALALIIEAWPELHAAIHAGIVAMGKASKP